MAGTQFSMADMHRLMTTLQSTQLSLSFRLAQLEQLPGTCNTLAAAQTSNAAELAKLRGMYDTLLAASTQATHVKLPVDDKHGSHTCIFKQWSRNGFSSMNFTIGGVER